MSIRVICYLASILLSVYQGRCPSWSCRRLERVRGRNQEGPRAHIFAILYGVPEVCRIREPSTRLKQCKRRTVMDDFFSLALPSLSDASFHDQITRPWSSVFTPEDCSTAAYILRNLVPFSVMIRETEGPANVVDGPRV